MSAHLDARLARNREREQRREYNRCTSRLDEAIRHLNVAKDFDSRGDVLRADTWRITAAKIIEPFAEFLIIDPEAKL